MGCPTARSARTAARMPAARTRRTRSSRRRPWSARRSSATPTPTWRRSRRRDAVSAVTVRLRAGRHGLGLVELAALRELELGPAARAERLMDRDDLAAARTAAVRLLALVAVEDRRDEPDERRDRGDQEPEQ